MTPKSLHGTGLPAIRMDKNDEGNGSVGDSQLPDKIEGYLNYGNLRDIEQVDSSNDIADWIFKYYNSLLRGGDIVEEGKKIDLSMAILHGVLAHLGTELSAVKDIMEKPAIINQEGGEALLIGFTRHILERGYTVFSEFDVNRTVECLKQLTIMHLAVNGRAHRNPNSGMDPSKALYVDINVRRAIEILLKSVQAANYSWLGATEVMNDLQSRPDTSMPTLVALLRSSVTRFLCGVTNSNNSVLFADVLEAYKNLEGLLDEAPEHIKLFSGDPIIAGTDAESNQGQHVVF